MIHLSHDRITLMCQCGCGTPFATVQDGCLVIVARHAGEKHISVLKLEHIAALLEQTVDTYATIGTNGTKP
jgi:hypothetical protein